MWKGGVVAYLLIAVSLLSGAHHVGSSRDQAQSIGTVRCEDGLASCPVHSSTCCLGKSNKYFCCPLPNAVCCADGLHCCPQCFSCNVKGSSCLRPAAEAAALRIFTLVSHTDKRIHTPPPTPPAAAAVAAVAKQRNIAQNQAAAHAAAVARKKAAEESESFVSGVLSAVKQSLFSDGKDDSSEKSAKVSPGGMTAHVGKSPQNIPPGIGKPTVHNPPKPPLKQPQAVHPVKAPIGISKPSGNTHPAANLAQGGKRQIKASPQAPTTAQKQPVPVTQKPNVGGTSSVQQQPIKIPHSGSATAKDIEAQKGPGFFSSVLSAVTGLYSGGNKDEAKPSDAKRPAATVGQQQQQQHIKQQQQQLLKQQQQQPRPVQAQARVTPQHPVVYHQHPAANQISKQLPQQRTPTPPIKQQIRTASQQLHKVAPGTENQKSSPAQINNRQLNHQGKVLSQNIKQAPGVQQNMKQGMGVGLPQKSAAAAIATQEKKAKAWEHIPQKKL